MDYKHKYLKYKNKYLKEKIKQSGGASFSEIRALLKTMTIDDLLKSPDIKKQIIDAILSTKRISKNDFDKLTLDKMLGEGHFGKTYKVFINDDIIKDNHIIVPKGTNAIVKIMSDANEENHNVIVSEIVSHTLINRTDCHLPKLYGFIENVIHDNKKVIIIISELVNGKNLQNELKEYKYDIMNSEHFYFINIWIHKLENTVNCLHRHGIVHRDIKVDNVMIEYNNNGTPTTNAILIDYGLSCMYMSFCLKNMYFPATSPIKFIKSKEKTRTIEIEKLNDYYALGILILDVLSLLVDNKLFHDTISMTHDTVSKLEFNKIMNEINEFINRILNKYSIAKVLTDKAYKYIRLGLSEKEMTVIESGIVDKELTMSDHTDKKLSQWYTTKQEKEYDVDGYHYNQDEYKYGVSNEKEQKDDSTKKDYKLYLNEYSKYGSPNEFDISKHI